MFCFHFVFIVNGNKYYVLDLQYCNSPGIIWSVWFLARITNGINSIV